MARCGCESVVAVGAAIEDGSCITWTGAGTPSSPFHGNVSVDAAADNLLSCGGSGLYVPAPVFDNADASMLVALVGPGDADYDLSVALAPDSDMSGVNLLDLFAGGLGINSGLVNLAVASTDSSMVGAPASIPDQAWQIIAGTQIVALDASANGTVTFPAAFSTVLLAFVPINGDAGATPAFVVSLGGATLNAVNIHCEATSTAVASLNVRITYIAIGY